MPPSRIALLPFAWLYGAVLALRHALYDAQWLKSTRPSVPTIAIGNLSFGGTGKTPMLELVLRTLEGSDPVATLSRGYGRTGNEYREVTASDPAAVSGDEPIQVKRKFPARRVFVGADRVAAIQHIQHDVPGLRAIVLDDALQHRALNAGLNILLTTWQRPWCDDALFPAGRLRDVPSRAKAAQVVVVTKCPMLPDAHAQEEWRKRLGLNNHQHLFFAGIEYDSLQPLDDRAGPGPDHSILLFTGIADPLPLVNHLRGSFRMVEHVPFPDHHVFTHPDLERLAARYATFAAGPKTLVTTEKDAARLGSVIKGSPLEGSPLSTIGMRTVILNEPDRFAELIRRHVATHTAHR